MIVNNPKHLLSLLYNFNILEMSKEELQSTQLIITKNKLDSKTTEISKLNEAWGGLIEWLVKINEQYSIQKNLENINNEFQKKTKDKLKALGEIEYLKQNYEEMQRKKELFETCANLLNKSITKVNSCINNNKFKIGRASCRERVSTPV